MATMYPAIFPLGAANRFGIAFDKQIFHTLTKLPDDWHVFYAARRERGPNGDQAYVDDEISDFVLVSKKAIVMIEGKATTVTWNNEDIMASYGNTKKSAVFRLKWTFATVMIYEHWTHLIDSLSKKPNAAQR